MSLQSIFYPSIIDYTQELLPNEVNSNNDINTILLEKVKNSIGDKCSKEGYIRKDSIKLIDRSIGKIISSYFNGNINFNLKLEVDVCNVTEGNIIRCKVAGINKVGIMCEKRPLIIVLSKLYHDHNLDKFESIQVGDMIDIEVICSRFEYNDNEISVVGKLADI
jgi:hypothetical protein